MELGKVPPHDEDAEQAVLGSMLTDNDAVMAAVEVLKEDAFYRADNTIIYQAILNLYSLSSVSFIYDTAKIFFIFFISACLQLYELFA